MIAIVLWALPGDYRESIARGVRGTVLRPVLALQQGTVEREARFSDPGRLRAQRDSLASYLVGRAALETENRQLREILGLRERLAPSFVPAQVVWLPGRATEGYFQLTAGADEGVEIGAPIVSAEGLVGRVREVDERVAFGIAWMNPDFRASAMTVDGEIYGIVEPRRGPGGDWMLALTGTPSHADLEEGTMLVTSGHGGVFPTGIPIGVVAGAEDAGTSWERTYLVRPQVGPSEMEYVLVLGAPRATVSGDNLAATWGIDVAPTLRVDSAAAAEAERAANEAANPSPAEPSGPRLLGVPARRPDGGGR